VNHGIRLANEQPVFVFRQAEAFVREITSENMNASMQLVFELRKIHVQLHRSPQTRARFLGIARADQQVQRIGMIREQV